MNQTIFVTKQFILKRTDVLENLQLQLKCVLDQQKSSLPGEAFIPQNDITFEMSKWLSRKSSFMNIDPPREEFVPASVSFKDSSIVPVPKKKNSPNHLHHYIMPEAYAIL
jgi:hypothetical protein